ncbi:jg16899 [Pararge aegeria aegeria]|uniref:Jg16899 protein n=1 Tax=Pararge aegeria aegeria TaxID=348720 RepID=A0A8S4SGE8_9NEOP|nr:jg16899 [Pararge aegeria aegeria]
MSRVLAVIHQAVHHYIDPLPAHYRAWVSSHNELKKIVIFDYHHAGPEQIGGLHTPLRTLCTTQRHEGFLTMFSFDVEANDIFITKNARYLERLEVLGLEFASAPPVAPRPPPPAASSPPADPARCSSANKLFIMKTPRSRKSGWGV